MIWGDGTYIGCGRRKSLEYTTAPNSKKRHDERDNILYKAAFFRWYFVHDFFFISFPLPTVPEVQTFVPSIRLQTLIQRLPMHPLIFKKQMESENEYNYISYHITYKQIGTRLFEHTLMLTVSISKQQT